MAIKAKTTGRKPAVTHAAKPAADAVTLTAAQALKAMDAATEAPSAAKRPYTRKAVAAPAAKAPAAVAPAPVPPVAAPAPPADVVAESVVEAFPETVSDPVVAEPEVSAPVVAETATTEAEITETPEAAVEPALAAAEGHFMMNDVIANTKKYTDDAKAQFQTAFADINAKAKAGVEKSTKALEEISDIAKGNVEALVESSKIAAKGVESLGQGAAEYGRLSFEKATATMKSLAAVKSPTEFFQLQSELMSSAFDGFAKEASKNSEAFLKLAGEVAQPISSRVSIVTDKVKSFAA